jgi:hypothetical protein
MFLLHNLSAYSPVPFTVFQVAVSQGVSLQKFSMHFYSRHPVHMSSQCSRADFATLPTPRPNPSGRTV